MKVQYILVTGQYSDYRIIEHLEGEDIPSIFELFNQYRDEYLSGFRQELTELRKTEKYLSPRSLFDKANAAQERLTQEGMFEPGQYWYTSVEDGFSKWLQRKHGFTVVLSEIFSVDLERSFDETSD